eukprot:scaffold6726_cov89-Isochrysis_galbana.AAC.5
MAFARPRDMLVPTLNEKAARAPASTGANGREHSSAPRRSAGGVGRWGVGETARLMGAWARQSAGRWGFVVIRRAVWGDVSAGATGGDARPRDWGKGATGGAKGA